jgi:hypothetical protein
MLTSDERALLRKYCHEHPVATCPRCSEALALDGLGTDIIIGRRDFCPTCRTDLTTALRLHLATCTVMRTQAREVRERARNGSRHADATHADEEQARATRVNINGLTERTSDGKIPRDGPRESATPGPGTGAGS